MHLGDDKYEVLIYGGGIVCSNGFTTEYKRVKIVTTLLFHPHTYLRSFKVIAFGMKHVNFDISSSDHFQQQYYNGVAASMAVAI